MKFECTLADVYEERIHDFTLGLVLVLIDHF